MNQRSHGRPAAWTKWIAPALVALAWGVLASCALGSPSVSGRAAVAVAAALIALGWLAAWWDERRRWVAPVRRLALRLGALADDPKQPLDLVYSAELGELNEALRTLKKSWQSLPTVGIPLANPNSDAAAALMTKSGLLAGLPAEGGTAADPNSSNEFTVSTDMVSRLDPRTLCWLNSSPAEQEFLGWNLPELREKSFLEIVHPDDFKRTRDELREALVKGEAHGVIVRVKTADGKLKAIEMNVSVRYGTDLAASHLRCHLTDVTAKLRAERELKLRTRELEQLNGQLRVINRELEDLKDRYRDLYQNAPAMYFSLDAHGQFLDCNDTLLDTLGYRREDLIGRSFERLLPPERRADFAERFAEYMRRGSIELESQWVKAGGETIDVWVSGTAVLGRDGKLLNSRSVAQDITARHRLEAELKEKNERLARTIEEVSRKNKEMDEFTYVVSHDLQEPLRTLIAFSDFLLRDCGDRLDDTGREYVQYLVDASRRMRALIHGLLTLSRAGRVTGDPVVVNLEEVLAVVKADLAELTRCKGACLQVAGPLPALWGDRGRIGQLFSNLVSNALKYNRSDGPRVEVGAAPEASEAWATIYVRDNGIGIDPQFHAKIFQLFRRLHTSEEYEGTGAGLSICAKIVEAHGGRIWVESQPGEGSTFFVRLPRALALSPEPEAQLSHAE
ncbi:MAG: PAS domain S-box protein [Isosphaeraceae bacterium]|nr:PAS domain S-box protein [Isosphaeraceae bacterium]